MSREIKFRAKRKDNGKWTYGDLIQLLGEQGSGRKFIVDNRFGACIDENGDFLNTEAPFVNEVDPETVGEYIGLKDKYGREIYEGDIVDDEQEPMKVEYQEGSFGLKFLINIKYFDNCVNWDCSEVIGNIYENPELLEV
jgi:uncharacterized phage protein (TIGR01671 family)